MFKERITFHFDRKWSHIVRSFSLFIFFFYSFSTGCLGQSEIIKYSITSDAVQADYLIEVVLPTGFSEKQKYPIVYCTDWFQTSGFLKSITTWLEFGRSAESVILVGISIEKSAHEWAICRYRDFTPSQPHDDYSIGYTYAPALELTGGAERFTKFLKQELVPFVESNYPSDTLKRGFIGYSLGGLLGTYILYQDPTLFNYYLIGSPSLWWDNFSLIHNIIKSNPKVADQGRIYLSVGGDEDGEMPQGFGYLRDYLRKNKSSSLEL